MTTTAPPTLEELTAKLELIALDLGGTIEPLNPGEDRYRLALHVYLPSGIPLFFQSDRSGLKYEVSISCRIQKINPVGWAKIARVLPETAWNESIYGYCDTKVLNQHIGIGWNRNSSDIVRDIHRRLLTPLAIAEYDKGVNAFVAEREREASFKQEMQEIWGACAIDPSTKMQLRNDNEIQFHAPGQTRVYAGARGWSVDVTGLSKEQLFEVLRVSGRLKPGVSDGDA